jgi:hypothetical protein
MEIQPESRLEPSFNDFENFLQEIIKNRGFLQQLHEFIYNPHPGQEPYNIEKNRDFCSILIEFYFRYKYNDKYNNEDILRLVNFCINKWYDVLRLEQRNEIDNLLNQIRERLNQSEHHS